MPQIYAAELAHLEAEAAMMVAEQERHAWEMQAARELVEDRLERERAQEALRRKQASRRLQAFAAAGGKVSECGGPAAEWVERQGQSVWHFGPVRRRRGA